MRAFAIPIIAGAIFFGAHDATEETGEDGEGDLFRAKLDRIINLKHELVQLAGKITGFGSMVRSQRSMATRAGPGSRAGS